MHILRQNRRHISFACIAFFIFSLFPLFSPVSAHAAAAAVPLVGPKSHYIALGDSVGFGYQPDLDWGSGYSTDFYHNLQSHGVTDYDNLACIKESSTSMINGGCPYAALHKYPYITPQLDEAVEYINAHQGQVSPVTLSIGANDIIADLDSKTCGQNVDQFNADLATLDRNLTGVILPRLHDALLVNGQLTGDLILVNYYDPYQNLCPNSVPYIQILNQHLAQDAAGYAHSVDTFGAFGGANTPNPYLCSYTWICSVFKDIHPRTQGYSVIAGAIENTVGY